MTEENKLHINEKEEGVKPGGYKVENVILLDSSFSRKISVDVKDYSVSNELNIIPEAHETSADNKFGVTLTLDYKGMQNDTIICTSKIIMIGIFEKFGEPQLSEENFKKINAPAIIYPFIREHLHNICLKSGIANVLLPTVNFKV
jgi:preprotein translocase subunit SecB